MRFVQPIKEIKKVSQIKNTLRGEGNIRDLLMFELGINSALRASDLLRIQVKDLFTVFKTVRESFEIKQKKTGKVARITITPKVKETLALYSNTFPSILDNRENFIFFAKKSFPLWHKHIGRIQAWKIVQWMCHDAGLQGSYGVHTMRKTFWYQARQNGISIELIQFKLSHSNIRETKLYLWISDEELAEACNKLDL